MKSLPRLCIACLAGTLTFYSSLIPAQAADETRPPNVVMIIVDDLNDWVGALSAHPQAFTPNIDKLAAEGVNFTQAFATSPLCGPSRGAFLSGMRASTTGFYDNKGAFAKNEVCMSHTSLPMFFSENGYETIGAGKIFHHNYDQFWDRFLPNGTRMYKVGKPRISRLKDVVGIFDYGPIDKDESQMDDYRKVSWAIEQLEEGTSKPFFLAVGIYLPHLPWYAPQEYFDLLPPVEEIYLEPVLANDLDDLPTAAVRASNPGYTADVRANGPLVRPEAVQAYLASIAFADAQVGRLMDFIDRLPDRDNTIIVLFGDHGTHLGTKHHWHKYTLWEESLRVPLIFHTPNMKYPGARCPAPVSLLDVYPTLAALCHLTPPSNLEGISLLPMLENPMGSFDSVAVSEMKKGQASLRTQNWRYTRYGRHGEELYNLAADPQAWDNLAQAPGAELVLRKMRARLDQELSKRGTD